MVSRNHHFVSRAFLKSFAWKNGKGLKIGMYDFIDKNKVETNIKNVAVVRDFNTVELEGEDPEQVEKFLSQFEQCIPEVACLSDSTESIDDWDSESAEQLFFMMGLFAAKNPHVREVLETYQKKVILRSLDQLTSSEGRFKEFNRRSGLENPPSYEFVRNLVESDLIGVDLNQSASVGLELKLASDLSKFFAARMWSIIRADDESSPFITSDRPVCLDWLEPERIPQFFRNSPGFGCRGTVVTFPITPKTCLIGAFETKPFRDRRPKDLVPAVNATIIRHANRQIFYPEEGFEFSTEKGVHPSDDLQETLPPASS